MAKDNVEGSSRVAIWRSTAFVAVAALVLLAIAPISASADILGFSDLIGCQPVIPSPYGGLDMVREFPGGVQYGIMPSTYGNSYGAPSGYAATNGSDVGSGVVEVSIASGTFDFLGASFSSFAGSNSFQAFSAESLQIYALRPGDDPNNPTLITTFDLDPTQYVANPLDWTGIDALYFGAGNGPAFDPNTVFGVDGLSWLMTDMDVTLNPNPVPEPSTFLSLGIGLAGVALVLTGKRS